MQPQVMPDMGAIGACDDVSRLLLQSLTIFEPAQFLDGADGNVTVRADREPALQLQISAQWKDAVAQVRFSRWTQSGDGLRARISKTNHMLSDSGKYSHFGQVVILFP